MNFLSVGKGKERSGIEPSRAFESSTSLTTANSGASQDQPERRHGAIEEELLSTADEIIGSCDRFRILVIGKAGAGKSSLINAAFNVDVANVSHGTAGVSDINTPITSEDNPRFVLHDSQGFAAGEVANFDIVKKFIKERSQMPHIKDRLHAIWFCLEIPTAGGSLFEVADREFLRSHLDYVPIIVVFTKYDLLVDKFDMEAEVDDTLSEDESEAQVRAAAKDTFNATCVLPLMDGAVNGKEIPYTNVSKEPGYEETLDQLMKLTKDHIDQAVWLIWAIAQRASVDLNIEASIQIGKDKYWRGLASSLSFPGKTLKKCLDAIHEDIRKVWNFHDPNMLLQSEEFKARMSDLVKDLVDQESSRAKPAMSIGAISGVAAVISGVIPPAAPVAVPVAVGVIFAQWVYMVYTQSPGVLRGLMGYIVDLTILMQSLFWLMQARGAGSAVQVKFIELAFDAYAKSGDRTKVHKEIRSYVTKTMVFKRGQRDQILEKVIDLIHTNRFQPPENYKVCVRDGIIDEADHAWGGN